MQSTAISISAAISTRLTASHPNSEVKLVRAGVVLRWGTTREGPVLRFFFRFEDGALLFFSFSANLAGFSTVSPACETPRGSIGKAEAFFWIRRDVGARCGSLATEGTLVWQGLMEVAKRRISDFYLESAT